MAVYVLCLHSNTSAKHHNNVQESIIYTMWAQYLLVTHINVSNTDLNIDVINTLL